MSRTRHLVFVTTLVAAVYLIATPFALSLFSRTRDAELLSDFYRPFMSEQGINQFGSNVKTVSAGGKELYEVFLPRLQQDLGLDETQLNTLVAQSYPHVEVFLQRAPEVVKYLNPAADAVLAQHDNFHDADQFPLANLPVTVGPWSLLLLGGALVVVALLIRAGPARWPLIAVVVVGLGLAAGPAVLGWFHQTDAAEQVAEAARAPFSAAVANATIDDTYKFDAAITEMRQAMFPDVAQQLGKSPTEMDTYLHSNFPAMMAFLDKWDASIYENGHALSLTQIEFMDEFHNADATPYRALPWVFMAPGGALLIAGALGLRRSRIR